MDLDEVVHWSPGIPRPHVKSSETESNLICLILSMFPTHMFLVNISTIPGSFWHAVRSKFLYNKCLLGICINSFQASLRLNLTFRKLFTSDIPGNQVFSTKKCLNFPWWRAVYCWWHCSMNYCAAQAITAFFSLILFCPVTHVSIAFCTRSKTIHLGLFKMLTLLLFF